MDTCSYENTVFNLAMSLMIIKKTKYFDTCLCDNTIFSLAMSLMIIKKSPRNVKSIQNISDQQLTWINLTCRMELTCKYSVPCALVLSENIL